MIACPGGLNEDSKNSIELFLRLEKADSLDFNAKYILGIVGKYGNKETKKIRKSGESCEAATFGEHLLDRCDFFNPALGYLIDDKVTLYCKVSSCEAKVSKHCSFWNFFQLTITAREITEKEKAASKSQNLLDVLRKMMIDAIFTDFRVVTSDRMVIKAHRSVLALRSNFFRGMLTSDMREAQSNIVKVPEDSAIMKEVLRYIYSNEVKNLSSLACELVFAAEKYQIDGLKELCLDSITKTLSTENTLQALLAADRLTKSEKLKAKCFEMIAR